MPKVKPVWSPIQGKKKKKETDKSQQTTYDRQTTTTKLTHSKR